MRAEIRDGLWATLLGLCIMSLAAPQVGVAQRPINQRPPPVLDDVEEKTTWVEEQPTPPAFPGDVNLVKFIVNDASGNEFFVDANSVSLGKDKVVRYTAVIKSSTGAKTIAFEGMRCDTQEKKIYATGRGDGTWSVARSGKWERIQYKSVNGYHRSLYFDYFCPNGIVVRTAEEAQSALKSGGHPIAKATRERR
jgi:hypothetical protein